MKECVIYHYWRDRSDLPAINNLRVPIITSIATLRACNPKIPIYVLDISENYEDLREIASHLNFSQVHWKPHLQKYNHLKGWPVLSRLFDINRFSKDIDEEVIIYCDSDVFWIKDPLPLHQDTGRFCSNCHNNGFFYYDKISVVEFFDIYEAFAITSIYDEAFRYINLQFIEENPSYFVYDEAIISYMYWRNITHFNKLDIREHLIARNIPSDLNVHDIKMLHMNGIIVQDELDEENWRSKYARGLTPLLLKEFYDRLCTVINPIEIYGQKKIEHYEPYRLSFYDKDFLQNLLTHSKTYDGLFDMVGAIKHTASNLKLLNVI